MRRQNHDLAGDAAFSHFFDQLNSGHVRHFLVDNDDIESLRTGIESRESGIAVFNGADFVARPGENVAEGKRNGWLVVHGQDSESCSAHCAL